MARNTHNSRRCAGCAGFIPMKRGKAITCSPACQIAARSARGKDKMPKHPPGSLR